MDRLESQSHSPFIVLTFDDGYRDFYDQVFPIALRYKVPVTTFVTTGIVDQSTPMWWHALSTAIDRSDFFVWRHQRLAIANWRRKAGLYKELDEVFRNADSTEQTDLLKQLSCDNRSIDLAAARNMGLTWRMLREMASSGLVEIGCHTINHPVLAKLGGAEISRQIRGSRERMRDAIGVDARFFAYPFGQAYEVGSQAVEEARSAGFEAAFSTEAALINHNHLENRWFLPRLMLSSKAQSTRIVEAYQSGLPFSIKARLKGHHV